MAPCGPDPDVNHRPLTEVHATTTTATADSEPIALAGIQATLPRGAAAASSTDFGDLLRPVPLEYRAALVGDPSTRNAWRQLLEVFPSRFVEQVVRTGFTVAWIGPWATVLTGPGLPATHVPLVPADLSRPIDSWDRCLPTVREAMGREIKELERSGVVERVPRTADGPHAYSTVFGITKASGKTRFIFNARRLNDLVASVPMRLTAAADLRAMLRENEWALVADLSQAFHSTMVDPASRDLLRFRWRGADYRYRALPMGTRFSPGTHCRITDALVAFLQAKLGVRIHVYVDDLALISASRERLVTAGRLLAPLLQAFGFFVNADKSAEPPAQRFRFIGFDWDTTTLSISVPGEKRRALRRDLSTTATRAKSTPREVARLLGQIEAMRPAWPEVRTMIVETHTWRRTMAKAGTAWDSVVGLPLPVVAEFQHLAKALGQPRVTTAPLRQQAATKVLVTDSSLWAWGAWVATLPPGTRASEITSMLPELVPENQTHQFWSADERREANSISSLEARTVEMALRSFRRDIPPGTRLHLVSDSRVTLAYLKRHQGRVRQLHAQTSRTFQTLRGLRIKLVSTSWVPSKENTLADDLSRITVDRSDWRIAQTTIDAMRHEAAHHDVRPELDAFATAANRTLPTYWSGRPDPGAMAVDAMAQPWTGRTLHANPPFHLIPRLLEKMEEEPCTVMLVHPVWPSRPWWPRVLEMSTALEWTVPTGTKLFSSGPAGSGEPELNTRWDTRVAVLSTCPVVRARLGAPPRHRTAATSTRRN